MTKGPINDFVTSNANLFFGVFSIALFGIFISLQANILENASLRISKGAIDFLPSNETWILVTLATIFYTSLLTLCRSIGKREFLSKWVKFFGELLVSLSVIFAAFSLASVVFLPLSLLPFAISLESMAPGLWMTVAAYLACFVTGLALGASVTMITDSIADWYQKDINRAYYFGFGAGGIVLTLFALFVISKI